MEGKTISRHPEMDADFYFQREKWPLGVRLYVKRFPKGMPYEMGYIERSPSGSLTLFVDSVKIGVVSPKHLLDEGWEVD